MKNTPNINTVDYMALQNLKNMTMALNFLVELTEEQKYSIQGHISETEKGDNTSNSIVCVAFI